MQVMQIKARRVTGYILMCGGIGLQRSHITPVGLLFMSMDSEYPVFCKVIGIHMMTPNQARQYMLTEIGFTCPERLLKTLHQHLSVEKIIPHGRISILRL